MSKFVAARVAAGNPLVRVYLQDTDGVALPDLTFGSSGLKIEYQRELSSTATAFSGSNLETISTIGTYAAPTSGKARFKELSSTTMQGWYEIHLPQAAVGTGDASRTLQGMASGVTGMRDCPFEIELVPDAIPNDSTQLARISDLSTLATAANLATVAGYIDTEVAAILADTNELQTDWANGGRLDLLIDAILARLPAALTADGNMKSDILRVIGVAIQTGGGGTSAIGEV